MLRSLQAVPPDCMHGPQDLEQQTWTGDYSQNEHMNLAYSKDINWPGKIFLTNLRLYSVDVSVSM